MAKRKVYDVSSRPDGRWQGKVRGAQRASVVTDTKAEAVTHTRGLAKANALGQMVIRGANGRIQTEHTYGKDPYPPKG